MPDHRQLQRPFSEQVAFSVLIKNRQNIKKDLIFVCRSEPCADKTGTGRGQCYTV